MKKRRGSVRERYTRVTRTPGSFLACSTCVSRILIAWSSYPAITRNVAFKTIIRFLSFSVSLVACQAPTLTENDRYEVYAQASIESPSELLPEVIGVDCEIRVPLLWNRAFFKDSRHGAGWLTGSAIDTLVRINIELIMLIVVGFIAGRMNAIDRAYIHTGAVLHPDTGLGNHIGHRFALLSLVSQDESDAYHHGRLFSFPHFNCRAEMREIHRKRSQIDHDSANQICPQDH